MHDVHAELDRALRGHFTLPISIDLERPHRFVFLSDQHKGAGDGADEFRHCKDAYHAALRHYRDEHFSLVLLGDVEELWEQSFARVKQAHADSLQLEGCFPASRYFRIWGNHDDAWMNPRVVARDLGSFVPHLAVYEGIRFQFFERDTTIGTLLCVHGHQGTLGSDRMRLLSRWAVRVWRYIQRATGIGQTTPSKDACLRGRHDRTMYEWAAVQESLILMAGHTHRPVWSSKTHLQILEDALRRFDTQQAAAAAAAAETAADITAERAAETAVDTAAENTADTTASVEAQRQALVAAIEERREKSPPCNDTEKAIPCYFNTGCCKYESGNITGIELVDGDIRLVRWRKDSGAREVLERASIRSIFRELSALDEKPA